MGKKRPSKRTKAGKINELPRASETHGRNTDVGLISGTELGIPTDKPSNFYYIPDVEHITTASEKKLSNHLKENINISMSRANSDFILVHKSVWPELLKDVLCSSCHNKSVTIQTIEYHGYAVKLLQSVPTECEFVCRQSYSAPRVQQTSF